MSEQQEKQENKKQTKKYLSIALFNGDVNIAAFKNEKKEKPTQPDYKGDGVAVWIKEYDPDKKKKVNDDEL